MAYILSLIMLFKLLFSSKKNEDLLSDKLKESETRLKDSIAKLDRFNIELFNLKNENLALKVDIDRMRTEFENEKKEIEIKFNISLEDFKNSMIKKNTTEEKLRKDLEIRIVEIEKQNNTTIQK